MPKVKWMKAPVRADHVRELIRRYMRAGRLTYDDIAPRVGMSASGARTKICHGGGRYTVEDLRKWGAAAGIPPEEIGAAVARQVSE